MKKTFILGILSCILCACTSSMHGLRVHNAGVKGKQKIDGGLYYNDSTATGHSEKVKHKVIDKTHAQIQIPVYYQEKTASLPKQLPKILEETLKKHDLKSFAECTGNCSLTSDTLSFDLIYSNGGRGDCSEYWAAFILWPLLPFTIPAYINCKHTELRNSDFSIYNPFEELNEKNLGVRIGFRIRPEKMLLNCDKKSCQVEDEQGKPINQIYIVKTMSVDQARIKKLLQGEREEEIRRAKAQRIWEKARKKECPGLYQVLRAIQLYGTTSYEVAIKTQNRFEELACGDYINQQISQYY